MNADSVAQRRQKSSCEELDALKLVQATGARKQGLEAIGVLLHCPCTSALGEFEQRRRAQGWSEPQIEEVLEPAPRRCAFIFLELNKLELGDVL